MNIYYKRLGNFTAEEYDKYFSMMDESRKAAVSRMRIENDRRRSVLGEALARLGISRLLNCNEEEITFTRTEKGKPLCVNGDAFFNVSHCGDIVICAVDGQNVGIDIEKIRDVEMRITRIACTDSDREYIFGEKEINLDEIEPNDEILKRLFTVWTAKEAYFKFVGIGIIGLRTVSYKDIKDNCVNLCENGFMLSIYSENENKGIEFKEVL